MKSKYIIPFLIVVIIAISTLIIFLLNPGNIRNIPTQSSNIVSNTTSSYTPEPAKLTEPTESAELPPTVTTSTDIIDFTVEITNSEFVPNIITAQAGETLRVQFISKSGSHVVEIKSLQVKSRSLNTGEAEVLTIKVPSSAKSGSNYQIEAGNGSIIATLKVI